VDSAGPLDEETGEPQHRPEEVYADRAYDSEPHREKLRARGIDPKRAKRYTEHGSGLGKYRWVVERFFAWLHAFRKMRLVTEKTQEMQFAFFDLALALICLRFL
jgi:transposase